MGLWTWILFVSCGAHRSPQPLVAVAPAPPPETRALAPLTAPELPDLPELHPPPAPPPRSWIDLATSRALDLEAFDGEDHQLQRVDELTTFFEAHPEYADESLLDSLLDLACIVGIGPAHQRLVALGGKQQYTIVLAGDDRMVVAFSSLWCTSEDWMWFNDDVRQALPDGVGWDYVDARYDRVVVRRGGEVTEVPVEGLGYLLLAADRAPAVTLHGMSSGVIATVERYFGE